ncbi:hypothetical protein KEM56_006967 [Ascosphaera pollenicola]|nr:hypothetical protein KEM56_006967 [Ascosphaera pollenicola]
MSRMTIQEAWEIVNDIANLEFPTSSLVSLQFALFRVWIVGTLAILDEKTTYGIPTISKLLVKTGQLASPKNSLKRYADTSVLITEFFAQPPSSARAHEAIARMNYIHKGYRASGKILDDDMLYTLALFACEPWRWIDTYEWRQLSDVELCAFGTFWKSIGDAMQISYEKLPSYEDEPGHGFKNGHHWLMEMRAWSNEYEKENMVPDINNKTTADLTVAVLLYGMPSWMHPVAREVVRYMMDDRLREAMMYPRSSTISATLIPAILSMRSWALRHLFLPLPRCFAVESLDTDPSTEVYHEVKAWEGAPFYVKPTFWRRWSPEAWITWALGHPLPGDDSEVYCPQGYLIRDIGPKAFNGKGDAYMNETRARLARERIGGCPFTISNLIGCQLLGLVVRDLKLTKDDMARYAEQMGNGCTEQAVYFQLYKLKRDGNTSQSSTPKKRGRKSKVDVEDSAKKTKEEPKDEHEVAAIKAEDDD